MSSGNTPWPVALAWLSGLFAAMFAAALVSAWAMSVVRRQRSGRDRAGAAAPPNETGQLRRLGEYARAVAANARASDTLYRSIIDSVEVAICIVDHRRPDHPIEHVNPAFERISGWSARQLVGNGYGLLFRGADGVERIPRALSIVPTRRGTLRRRLRHCLGNGRELWCEVQVTVLRGADGEVSHSVAVVSDLSPDARRDLAIDHLANFDHLTGLPNRDQLRQRIDAQLARDRSEPFSILLVDLDHFKVVNDSLGHKAGDDMLVIMGIRLKSCVREGDLVARLGGDEFGMLVRQGPRSSQVLGSVLDRIRQAVSEPLLLRGRTLHATCSVGVSRYPDDGGDADTLLRKADAAMYVAKRDGRNEARAFTGDIECAINKRLNMETSLHRALERSEFVLHYQPMMDLKRGGVVGAETLLRWQDPVCGRVGPDEFIGVAEETGLIQPIGEWVLRTACRQALDWKGSHGEPLALSVNLSPRQLRDGALVDKVRRILEETGFDPQRLEFELTESLFTDECLSAAEALRGLSALGVRLSIDDFGTGYSNLRYLTRFPVTRLKIDRSFVSRIGDDPGHSAIVNAIIMLAHSVGLGVVGEGVETDEQRQWLDRAGCDVAQGFLLGRPMPPAEFEALLRRCLHCLDRAASDAAPLRAPACSMLSLR